MGTTIELGTGLVGGADPDTKKEFVFLNQDVSEEPVSNYDVADADDLAKENNGAYLLIAYPKLIIYVLFFKSIEF